MNKIALTCKDPSKFFHDCEGCKRYNDCDYFQKPKRGEIKLYTKADIKSMVRNYDERLLNSLKGNVWLCQLEHDKRECSGAASCIECLGVPANFEDFVVLIQGGKK